DGRVLAPAGDDEQRKAGAVLPVVNADVALLVKRHGAPPFAAGCENACTAFEPALFWSEHIDGDTASVDRAGPAGIERYVRDQPLQLGLRHPVVERPLHVAPHLVAPLERSQHCPRDQATARLLRSGCSHTSPNSTSSRSCPSLGTNSYTVGFFCPICRSPRAWVPMAMESRRLVVRAPGKDIRDRLILVPP